MRKPMLFAAEYVANGGDASAAYVEVYGDGIGARKVANAAKRLLGDPTVAAKVRQLQERLDDAVVMNAKDVLARWAEMAQADIGKIVRVVARACRHCHGVDHRYQWRTPLEYQDACDAARASKKPPPLPPLGGFGYAATATPHPRCPHCDGLGERDVELTPTENLGRAERLVFEGAKMGKHGIEVQAAKPHEFLKLIAQALGVLGTPRPTGPAGAASDVPTLPVDATEAARIYADFVRGG